MATATGTRRAARAAAARQSSKDRRQKLLAIGGAALLVVLLAYEVPHTLHLLSSSGSSPSHSAAVAVTLTPTAPAPAAAPSKALRAALRQAPHDVFAAHTQGSATTLGSVATPPGLHDPFAKASTSGAQVAPVAAPAKPVKIPALPGTIVLGTPGADKVAIQGWIVILASIPTAAGQSSATSFAGQAAKAGVGHISVLNSSNRRPLRGGYWVVYTGPYSTLGAVSTAAANVHKSGFGSAYIRELIVYKQKPGAHKAAKHKAAAHKAAAQKKK